jgi:hypothetical protein
VAIAAGGATLAIDAIYSEKRMEVEGEKENVLKLSESSTTVKE